MEAAAALLEVVLWALEGDAELVVRRGLVADVREKSWEQLVREGDRKSKHHKCTSSSLGSV